MEGADLDTPIFKPQNPTQPNEKMLVQLTDMVLDQRNRMETMERAMLRMSQELAAWRKSNAKWSDDGR